MKVVVVVGGVGGARFLLGVKAALGLPAIGDAPSDSEHQITALVNTGDDVWLHGLRICPDLDTCMYTLGGGIDTDRGWGHSGETWTVKEELAAYEAEPGWFGLGSGLAVGQLFYQTQPTGAITAWSAYTRSRDLGKAPPKLGLIFHNQNSNRCFAHGVRPGKDQDAMIAAPTVPATGAACSRLPGID